jgi:hypothetical protein
MSNPEQGSQPPSIYPLGEKTALLPLLSLPLTHSSAAIELIHPLSPSQQHSLTRVGNWHLTDLIEAQQEGSLVTTAPAAYDPNVQLLDFSRLSQTLLELPPTHTLRTGLLAPADWAPMFDDIDLSLDPATDILTRARFDDIARWSAVIGDTDAHDTYLQKVGRATHALAKLCEYIAIHPSVSGEQEAFVRIRDFLNAAEATVFVRLQNEHQIA